MDAVILLYLNLELCSDYQYTANCLYPFLLRPQTNHLAADKIQWRTEIHMRYARSVASFLFLVAKQKVDKMHEYVSHAQL